MDTNAGTLGGHAQSERYVRLTALHLSGGTRCRTLLRRGGIQTKPRRAIEKHAPPARGTLTECVPRRHPQL